MQGKLNEIRNLVEPLSNGKKGTTAQIYRLIGDGYFSDEFVQKNDLKVKMKKNYLIF